MSIPLDTYRSLLNSEALNVIDLMQEEYGVPPMFTCLHLGGFLFSNIIASYERQGIQMPDGLLEFMKTTYPKMLEQQQPIIETQYLTLNTEGTA